MGSALAITGRKVTLELFDVTYDFRLSLMGSRELALKYGSTNAAFRKINAFYERAAKIEAEAKSAESARRLAIDNDEPVEVPDITEDPGIRAEEMDVLFDLIHACLVHNEFDDEGRPNGVKVPTVTQMLLRINENQIRHFYNQLAANLRESVPIANKGE